MDVIDSPALETAIRRLTTDGMEPLYQVVDPAWWWAGSDAVRQVGQVAAGLHNGGELDLIAFLLAVEPNEALENKNAKSVGALFWGLLPEIDASPDQIHAVLLHLTAVGAIEDEAYWIGGKLKLWLSKDEARSRRFLALARAEPHGPVIGLFDALVAGGETDPETYLDASLSLLGDERQGVRKAALIALSNIPGAPDVHLNRALSALEGTLKAAVSSDDQYFVLTSLLRLYAQQGFNSQDRMTSTLDLAFSIMDPPTLRSASASALSNQGIALGMIAVETILLWLGETPPEEADTVRTLDYALYRLIDAGGIQPCIRFVMSFLKAHSAESITRFKMLASGLTQKPELFGAFIYESLRDGSPEVCTAARTLLTQQGHDRFRISLDMAARGATPTDRVRIARRSVGYLLHLPLATASILIAAMRGTDQATQRKVGQLVLNPLLMNYSGDAYDYIRRLADEASDDDAAPELAKVLKTFEEYRDALMNMARIRELEPSENHRHMAREHWDEQMAESEAAHEPSGLAALFSRSVILFGSKSVVHVFPSMKAEPVRTVMNFQTVGYHQELPKLSILDPVMQSYQGFQFRHGDDAE